MFSSLGSTEMFLGTTGVGVEAVIGKTESLAVSVVGEAGGLCGEFVQMPLDEIIFA